MEAVVEVADPDGEAVACVASDLPDGATYDDGTRTFAWTPTLQQAGRYTVVFDCHDGLDGTAQAVFVVEVGNLNRPPEIQVVAAQAVAEGETLEFAVTASDPDDDELTFAELVGAWEPFFHTDEDPPRFEWTPGFDQKGRYSVTFTATDDGDGTASENGRAHE